MDHDNNRDAPRAFAPDRPVTFSLTPFAISRASVRGIHDVQFVPQALSLMRRDARASLLERRS